MPSKRKKQGKRKPPPVPKNPNTIDATVILIEHAWAVTYVNSGGEKQLLNVTDEDAWNFDIERNLTVQITLDAERDGFCKIHSKQGNKKYVTIEKMGNI